MSYQVVKGWPSEGALDEVLVPATGVTIAPGSLASLDNAGKAVVADFYADATDRLTYFAIDNDPLNGGLVGLKAGMIIECDADHYEAGTYTPNQAVTAKAGQFAAITTAEKQVARVISFDAVTGKMRLVWTALG